MVRRPPTAALRESQWRDAFAKADGSWFCLVIEAADDELIGFAKGNRTGPERGDLNKIYLLSEYPHGSGLGRRLVGHVVRRFLGDGIRTMTLSADAGNPSCQLTYLAIGAESSATKAATVPIAARSSGGTSMRSPARVRRMGSDADSRQRWSIALILASAP